MTAGKVSSVIVVAFLVASCATITKGTDQVVSVDTPNYPGAQCTLSSRVVGSRTVTTPATLELPKSKDDIRVSCSLGCARGTGIITSNTEGMTAGNVILGGVIGLGVDAASGAMNRYSEVNNIFMQPAPGCLPAQPLPSPPTVN
jgi:hypothetical protein